MQSEIKWIHEINYFAGVCKAFVIEGNIHDNYLVPGYKSSCSIEQIIGDAFRDFCPAYKIIHADPINGLNNRKNADVEGMVENDNDIATIHKIIEAGDKCKLFPAYGADTKDDPGNAMVQCTQMIRALLTQTIKEYRVAIHGERQLVDVETPPYVIIFNMSSRLLANIHLKSKQESLLFNHLYDAALNAIVSPKRDGQRGAQNTLILLAEKLGDIPNWIYIDNPNVRTISIPNPDRSARKLYVEKYFASAFPKEADQQLLIDMTDGFKIKELDNLLKLYLLKNRNDMVRVEHIVNAYKFGFAEDHWKQYRKILQDCPGQPTLKERFEAYVKGQDQAINKVIEALRRTALGLSGLQHSSNSSKPKVVLFLAGPTGTGKTELLKTIARILTHDENTLVRFDMSEYHESHTDQKLFGAPPGYVGYEAGGRLTNAVRANPKAMLLFDEIDKADSSIMDKFLQILEDGRMTDGQGNTISFADTLIFFTSNLGMEPGDIVDPVTNERYGKPLTHEDLVNRAFAGIRNKYKQEAIGRIGKDNIIVFDFTSDEVARKILVSKLAKIASTLQERDGIPIHYEPVVDDLLKKWTNDEKARIEGGRGVGNIIEACFLSPLGTFLSANQPQPDQRICANWGSNDSILFTLMENEC